MTDTGDETEGRADDGASPATFTVDDPELTSAIQPTEDERSRIRQHTAATESGGEDTDDRPEREVQRDLTPEDVAVSRPDEFDFSHVPTSVLPDGIQYTPEFDPDWVFPTGSADGGRQDDAPVQGIEIGVVATADTLDATVRAVLDALSLYYEDTGQYPRHRIISSATTFEEYSTGGAGLAAVFQPSPDIYDGLMEHMKAVRSGADGAVDSNVETSRHLVQYLAAHLAHAELTETPADADVTTITGWDDAARIGSLPLVERYAPLGAAELYDPDTEEIDLTTDGVSSIDDADFTPQRLSIETDQDVFDPPQS